MTAVPEQKPVFATHGQATAHVDKLKQEHVQKTEEQDRKFRNEIGSATEEALYTYGARSTKSVHTIHWAPGQYEEIFGKK